jgi:hypothetical protein
MAYYLGMNTKQINPVKRALRRYYVELAAAMTSYVAVVLVRGWVLTHWESRGSLDSINLAWVLTVALLPMVPLCFVFWAVVRFFRGMDELGRRVLVDSIAIAGGVTAMLAASYGFIEGQTFPHVSAWWGYAVFMTMWLIASFFVARRYK